MIIYNQKGRKSPSNISFFRGLNMIDITLLKNFPLAYEEAEKKGLLNKKYFVVNAFSEELIGAYDSFDEAWEANQIK